MNVATYSVQLFNAYDNFGLNNQFNFVYEISKWWLYSLLSYSVQSFNAGMNYKMYEEIPCILVAIISIRDEFFLGGEDPGPRGDPNLVSKVHIFGAGAIFENFRNWS